MDDLYYLNESYIQEINRFVGLRNDQLDAVIQSLRAAAANDDLVALSLQWKKDIFSSNNPFNVPLVEDRPIPEAAPLLPLIVLFAGAEELRIRYSGKGIPEKILTDTLFDANRNLDECKARNGAYIIEGFVFGWLVRHFTGRLYHLGRLQFEAIRFGEDNELLRKGDYVLNVHIPSGGRLPYEDIRASYKQAISFFRKLMPDIPFKGLICESWMLSPQLTEILDGSSNLLRFLDDYRLYGTGDDESFYPYVFVTKPDDLNMLSEETSLQRAIKVYVLSGGKILSGRGFIPIDTIK